MVGLILLIIIIASLIFIYDKTKDASLIAAIGTVFVSIIAIWGEKIRYIFASPRLELRTLGFGKETRFKDGTPALFYYLEMINKRTWVPAKNVKVICTEIAKKGNDETEFKVELTNVPQQITWSPMEFHQIMPTITKKDVLDLGYIVNKKFILRTYITPNNFEGFIKPGQTMRVKLEILADNFSSPKPYIFEISFEETSEVELQKIKKFVKVK